MISAVGSSIIAMGLKEGVYQVTWVICALAWQWRGRGVRSLVFRSLPQLFFKRSTIYIPFVLVGAYFANEVRSGRPRAAECTS